MQNLVDKVRRIRDTQGMDGNWNYDPYMQGLYNGIEIALSIMEKREPDLKSAPFAWLSDKKVGRLFPSETEPS